MAAPIRSRPLRRSPAHHASGLGRTAAHFALPRCRGAGFTLLEVLVVVFLIGIVLTLAVLSVGHNEDRILKDEARRLATLLELARQESIVESLEMALAIDDRAYSFQMFDGRDWLPITDDPILRPRELPEEMELKVEIEGQLVEMMKKAAAATAAAEKAKAEKEAADAGSGADGTADDSATKDDAGAERAAKREKSEANIMRIFLLSSGEMTPFEIIVRYADREDGYTVTGNAIGEISVAPLRKEEA